MESRNGSTQQTNKTTPGNESAVDDEILCDPLTAELEKTRAALIAAGKTGFVDGDRKQYRPQDFYYDTMQDKFWCGFDLSLRTPESIDALIPYEFYEEGRDKNGKFRVMRPSEYLKRVENDRVVEGSTWWPGQARVINNVIVTADGVMDVPGARCFNTYNEPKPLPGGDPEIGKKWADFIADLFDTETADYLVQYFAHLVQKPHEKCNAIIAITGEQGIGKDTMLEAIRNIVGTWNCREISPDMVFESFDPWKQALMVVVNEARPQNSEHMQWQFYEKLKVMGAAPPHWLHVNAKFERMRYVRNVMRTIITFNKMESLYVPSDDRRIFIARSYRDASWLTIQRRNEIHALVSGDDVRHVAAFLRAQDLTNFDPFGRPPRGDAWNEVSATWNEREGDVLHDALNELNFPPVVLSPELSRTKIGTGLDTRDDLIKKLRSPRFSGSMTDKGYVLVPRPKGMHDWRFGASDSPHAIRCRTAFMRRELFNPKNKKENEQRVILHGQKISFAKTDTEGSSHDGEN
jgi:hypothetical protein